MEVAPAEAVDVAAHARAEPPSAKATSAQSGGAPPGESERSSTITSGTSCEQAAKRVAGNGRNERIFRSADALAFVAQLVDDVLDRPRGRAERDDHAVGTLDR